jgi:hypothetical protein
MCFVAPVPGFCMKNNSCPRTIPKYFCVSFAKSKPNAFCCMISMFLFTTTSAVIYLVNGDTIDLLNKKYPSGKQDNVNGPA